MKYYYKEMAVIAEKLTEMGFKYDTYNIFRRGNISISFNNDHIIASVSEVSYTFTMREPNETIAFIKNSLRDPYWEVDGIKLISRMSDDFTDYYFLNSNNYILQNCHSYSPMQIIGKESDFTVLYKDGSIKYAKYIK